MTEKARNLCNVSSRNLRTKVLLLSPDGESQRALLRPNAGSTSVPFFARTDGESGLPVDTVTDEDGRGRVFVKYHVNDVFPEYVIIYRYESSCSAPLAVPWLREEGRQMISDSTQKQGWPGGQRDLQAHQRHQALRLVLQVRIPAHSSKN